MERKAYDIYYIANGKDQGRARLIKREFQNSEIQLTERTEMRANSALAW